MRSAAATPPYFDRSRRLNPRLLARASYYLHDVVDCLASAIEVANFLEDFSEHWAMAEKCVKSMSTASSHVFSSCGDERKGHLMILTELSGLFSNRARIFSEPQEKYVDDRPANSRTGESDFVLRAYEDFCRQLLSIRAAVSHIGRANRLSVAEEDKLLSNVLRLHLPIMKPIVESMTRYGCAALCRSEWG